MMCLLPGTQRCTNNSQTRWIAYGTHGGKFTVYNDGVHTCGLSQCAQSSAIMHKIVHNLSLHHSDRYDDRKRRPYQDKSGLVSVENTPFRFPHIFTQ